MVNPSLIRELGRLFNAKAVAIECGLRHEQITVDGYVMQIEHDRRWSRGQLAGRMAEFVGRQAVLFDSGARACPIDAGKPSHRP